MARKVTVEIVGDESRLLRSFRRSETAASKFGRSVNRSASSLGSGGFGGLAASIPVVGVALAGLGAVMAKSVQNASDLNEAMTQSSVVFGQSAKQIEDWSETTAASFGIAQQQALQTAAGFGALLKPLGVLGPEAARQSRQLTELGADLASFYNTSVQDALDAVRSGLVGEAEPLRRYGVRLSETRVQALAMAESGKKTAKSLTDQEKTLARITLIYRDSTLAQGDFARTSEGLANQQRTLTALLKDASAQVGQALLPAVTKVTGALNDWLKQPENVQALQDAVLNLVAAMQKMVDIAKGVIDAWKGVVKFLKGAWLEMKRDAIEGVLGIIEPFSHLPDKAGQWARDLKVNLKRDLAEIADDAARLAGTLAGLSERALDARRNRASGVTARPAAGAGPIAPDIPRGDTAAKLAKAATDAVKAIQTPWLDYLRALANSTKTLRDDLAVVRRTIEVLTGRLATATTLKAKTELVNALNQYREEEASLTREMAESRRQLAEARRERALAERNARQFGLLGLGATGGERLPSFGALRKRLGRFTDAIQGTFLDTKKTRSLLANIRKIFAEGIKNVSSDVLVAIKALLDDLDQQLKDHAQKGDRTKFRPVKPEDILAGLGLTPEQEREARARMARVGATGTTATGPSATAFGKPIPERERGRRRGKGLDATDGRPVVINVQVDGRTIATAALPHLQKEAGRRGKSSRGPNAGSALGFA